ncbi:tetraspanin-2 [Nymphaea colorata]|nr:tetraspanin-2 [Nymphaea colorata]
MAVSNNITAALNFVALLCSVPIIGAGIWLASKPDNECVRLIRWPLIILGVLILLVSLAGFVGAFWRLQCLLALHLLCMLILILLLLFFTIFAFVVTSPNGAVSVPGRQYQEFRLSGFSGWLRNYVTNSGNWAQIRTCLSSSDVCPSLAREYSSPDQFFASSDISPLQSGCCKPPTMCGYNYVNPTLWVNPINPAADTDCYLWSNDQSQLCYNCNSCKAGLLGNMRKEWRKANVVLIVTLVVLIWVYMIACSAFRNAQTEALFRRYKQGYV